ncbi:MAG: family 20 glycosylhydrolase, partial [Saprospiraceae bacterium]
EFKYRGMHLDVSRHFFSVPFIKLYIDLLARYKFNTFHWHLTDDQGWRIEIKKFPDLTEIGSKRKETLIGAYGSSPVQYDNTEYGGYYTQEEIRDVVNYASARYIEIIPEIEMPGHSAALLASYPQYSCSKGTHEVATTWGVMNNVICPTDTSLWFMKEILDEVCDLFPGKYIHIGGDEVSKDEWKKSDACTKIMLRQNLKNYDELQSYFIKQINFFLTKKGKILIGWDEILEGGLSQNAVVMSWRGVDGGIQAARQKHEVIMTPGTHCYFDHYQSISNQEPLAIGGFTSLEKAYSFNPIPDDLQPEYKKYILGAQGNVWTEYMSTPEQVLYMAFPRAIALSEVTWTSKEKRNYSDFVQRLNQHIKWFKANNINISTAFLDLSYRTYSSPEGVQMVFNKAPVKGQILVETNSVEEGINQEYLSSDTMLLQHDMEFKSWYQLPDNRLGRSLSLAYKHHKFTGKTVSYSQNPSTKYSSGGLNSIVNGIDAPINKFSGPEWIGFDEGNNMEAIIENSDTLNMITVQLFQEESSWVYLPQSIEVYSSDDNIMYQLEGKNMLGLMPGRGITQSIKFSTPVMKRYIKVLIQNHGMIEEGRPGAGHGAWLFVGELKAE